MLAMLACFAHKIARRITGMNAAACDAPVGLCDLSDALQAINLGGAITPDYLRGCINVFLQAVVAAGWRDVLVPKFYWLVHLPNHLARFGRLPTCFVHERKHKFVKQYAADIKNTMAYATSVLPEIIPQQL